MSLVLNSPLQLRSSPSGDVDKSSSTVSTRAGLEVDFNLWIQGITSTFPHISSDLNNKPILYCFAILYIPVAAV